MIKPKNNETLKQYQYRLSENKSKYKLSWSTISELINKYYRKQYSKDYLRHDYYGMKKRNDIDIENDNEYIKVLIMNDIHLPYNRSDILKHIEKNKDVDYIIIAGDLIDCESCSFWDNWNRPSVEEELIIAHDFISKVNEIINPEKTQIISLLGNHEYRYEKEIIRMQEKQLKKLLNPKLLSMLEKGFTYYEKDKDITYKPINNFKYVDNWYTRLFNNLIVAHPTDFSGVDGKMCEKSAEYFLNEDIAERGDIIVFGHTHKFSSMKVNRRQGVFVIENGCMCQEMDYAKRSGKLRYTPQNYCYTVLKFKNNEKVRLNDIKVIHLD